MEIKNDYMERRINNIFDNFLLTEAKVVREKNVTIEVKTKEAGHNIPHCHIERGKEQQASVSLKDFTIIADSGNFNEKQKNAIIRLVKEHQDELRTKWEEYFGTELLKDSKWE